MCCPPLQTHKRRISRKLKLTFTSPVPPDYFGAASFAARTVNMRVFGRFLKAMLKGFALEFSF